MRSGSRRIRLWVLLFSPMCIVFFLLNVTNPYLDTANIRSKLTVWVGLADFILKITYALVVTGNQTGSSVGNSRSRSMPTDAYQLSPASSEGRRMAIERLPYLTAGRIQIQHRPVNLILMNAIKKTHNDVDSMKYADALLGRLLPGAARTKLDADGVSCVKDPNSTFCMTSAAVRITAGPMQSSVVYLSADQRLPNGDTFEFKPYPRTDDAEAMRMTTSIKLVADEPGLPPCDVNYSIPAVVFSVGGLTGNFYNDVNDVLVPLFLTASVFRSQVQLVVTDYESYWVERYRRFLFAVSNREVVVATSRSWDAVGSVHCFPTAIVGLKSHGHLSCNASEAPGGIDTLEFKRFLHESFSLKISRLTPSTGRPLLLLLSLWRSRAILNKEKVMRLAEEIGFRVELGWPDLMTNKEEASELVNSCSVLVGVYDASLTNMLFLPSRAVLLQIIPLGLSRQADSFYGRQTVERFGLKYVEYKTAVEESSLYGRYLNDHTVADPFTFYHPGYENAEQFYMNEQNITIDIYRFRGALKQAMALLPRSYSLLQNM